MHRRRADIELMHELAGVLYAKADGFSRLHRNRLRVIVVVVQHDLDRAGSRRGIPGFAYGRRAVAAIMGPGGEHDGGRRDESRRQQAQKIVVSHDFLRKLKGPIGSKELWSTVQLRGGGTSVSGVRRSMSASGAKGCRRGHSVRLGSGQTPDGSATAPQCGAAWSQAMPIMWWPPLSWAAWDAAAARSVPSLRTPFDADAPPPMASEAAKRTSTANRSRMDIQRAIQVPAAGGSSAHCEACSAS